MVTWRLASLLVATLVAACSRGSEKGDGSSDPSSASWSEVRGDSSPPAWATPDLGWAGDKVYARLFDAAAETLPSNLAHSHVICSLTAITDGNPLDGARDLAMTWTVGGKALQRLCNVNESPCFVGFTEGAVASGQLLRVHAIDVDTPGEDDDIGTFEGMVEGGSPFAIAARELTVSCRAASPRVVREQLAPLLRVDLPKRIAALAGMTPEARTTEIYVPRNHVVRAAGITGWDHPDVWPLVKALDQAAAL
jgi:hypothetical protein